MKLSEQKSQYIKLLQMGGSGTGKTTAASTFPKPIYIAMFDPEGHQSLLTHYRDNPKVLDQIDIDFFGDADNRKANGWKRFETKKNELLNLAAKGQFPYATCLYDSLTTMEDAAMNELKVLLKANRTLGQPTQQDYGILIGMIELLIPELLSMPCHVIMNAHIQTVQDGITQEIMRLPLVTGKKLPQKLPLWFGETYRTIAKKEGGKTEYLWQIRSTDKFDLKSRIIPREIEGPIAQNFAVIAEHLTFGKQIAV